jgi:flagella basal body P-ring formation protein FlgA
MRTRAPAVLAVLMAAAHAAAGVSATVRAEATVDSERVTLADVAEVAGAPAALVARLRDIDLGPAPAPGHDRDLTRTYLALRLRQERLEPDSVAWAGAETTRVVRRSTRVLGATIAQAAAERLRKTLPWPDEDLVIEVPRPPADLTLAAAPDELRYTIALSRGQRLVGAVPVLVTVGDGEHVLGRTSLLLNVRLFQRVVVARRRIQAGERLTKDHVGLQRTELTSLAHEALTDLGEVLGQEARQTVPAFAVLTSRQIAPPRLVERGSLVLLVAETQGLRITARGIAQQDGAAGQVIRVQNIDSKKVVFGQVVAAQTVRVPF